MYVCVCEPARSENDEVARRILKVVNFRSRPHPTYVRSSVDRSLILSVTRECRIFFILFVFFRLFVLTLIRILQAIVRELNNKIVK